MKIIIYRIWQSTWGILQTFLGLIMFIKHFKSKHYTYHGAFFTEGWANRLGEWVTREKSIDMLVLD